MSRSGVLAGWTRVEAVPARGWTLSEAERRRLEGLRDPRRADQFRAGRWLLRALCAGLRGGVLSAWSLNGEGRPEAFGPDGAPGPRLALAHSGPWVLGAASEGPCGVDVEARGRDRDWEGLAAHLGLADAGEEAVLRAWTLREARFKAGDEAAACVTWRCATPALEACLLAPAGAPVAVAAFGIPAPPPFLEVPTP